MVRKPNLSSKTLIAAFVAAAFGLPAGAALAQTTTSHDSRDVAAANSPAARHVTLTDRQSEQTLHYSSSRTLRICNLSGRSESLTARVNAAEQRAPEDFVNPATRAGATSAPTPVALQVSYGSNTDQIQPGNCYDFRARDVRLSPAQRLPAGSGLVVAIAPISGNGFVNGRTTAAASYGYESGNASSKESVKQLKEQLKQDDEQERQANAELSSAREKLAQTTRDLKQAQSKERHVASTERQTASKARRGQQNAEQSERNDQQSQPNGGTPE